LNNVILVCAWWKSSDRWDKVKLTDDNVAILNSISTEFQKYDTDKSGTIDKDVIIIVIII